MGDTIEQDNNKEWERRMGYLKWMLGASSSLEDQLETVGGLLQ